jgi:hypothetical protein
MYANAINENNPITKFAFGRMDESAALSNAGIAKKCRVISAPALLFSAYLFF